MTCPGMNGRVTLPTVIQNYLEAYNRKDLPALMGCVSDDVQFENVSNTGQALRTEGRAAFAEVALQAAVMFTSRRQTVRTAVVDGDKVALEIDWVAIPATDIGAMKAGVEVTMRGASFITIANGKLARIIDIS